MPCDEQNEAIRRQYADQARDAIAEWRSQLQAATGQAVALSDEVLEAPGQPTFRRGLALICTKSWTPSSPTTRLTYRHHE
jgi:hypothetical protein